MLSAWDSSLEPSTPVTSFPSRQMLEYLCVSLQGCAKLCIFLASLCEQAALIMIETIHSGMFLSSNLVFLAIVSRVRVLICNFSKSAVEWYDNLIAVRSSLPSTNSEWLLKDTQLPSSLTEWLGDEATRLALDVTSSKNASDVSLLDRLFNTSLEVSMDTGDGGEREVTAVGQLSTNTAVTLPDLGEKLSRADLASLVMARSKQGYNPQVLPRKQDGASKKGKVNDRMTSPPRKRRRTKARRSWHHTEEGQSPKVVKQKLKVKGFGSKLGWPTKKLNIGSVPRYGHLTDNVFTGSSKKQNRSRNRSKPKGLASSILTAMTVQRGKVCRRTSVSQRLGSSSYFRRSLSSESTSSNHLDAIQNPERGKRLQQHIAKVKQRKKRSRSGDKSSDWNSLVIKNTAVSSTPSSAIHTAAGPSHNSGNGYRRDHPELFSSSPSHISTLNRGRQTKASMSSITQPSAVDTTSYRGRHSAHQTRNKPKASSNIAKEQGLPDSMLPSSRYEPSKVSTVQGSTSKSAGTVSMLGTEPKLTKKRKIVKRLKKLKQTFLGKNRAVGRMQTVPDSTLYYANQMSIPRNGPMRVPQDQQYDLPHFGDQRQHHHHQYSMEQHHHHSNKQWKHVDYSDHHGHQQVQILPNVRHNLSHKIFKRKGQKSHETLLPKQELVVDQNKGNNKDKGYTDHDMDSIFSSLL
eukprot:XP_011682595.1 PREDICTED: uncharacterized protein LOC763820 [Strongylocentrotus purpuratus]